ncbi:MAG: hypothetical protein M5T61_02185 [Acidimicrobiia bacterium]|nr:hypothetical protein [Acidimicrobiia bacterium]
MPYNDDADGSLGLPINGAGEFRGGLVIPPSEPIGEKTFAVYCYQPGAHVGLGLRGVPFEIAGAPVEGLPVRAVPNSGSAGTHVSLSGSGCILEGEPLADARVKLVFVTGGPSVDLDLSASIDSSGNWATEFTVPADAATAEVSYLTLVCDAPDTRIGNFKSRTVFAVEAVSPPTTAEVSPPTTAEVSPPTTAEVSPPTTAEVSPPTTAVTEEAHVGQTAPRLPDTR